MSAIEAAVLVLSDGELFEGEAIGARPDGGVATGEVVFNTVLTGYQEVMTDPSYAGQMITFTYPHIGNYGVSIQDHEGRRPFCRGVIVRDLARRRSNWRSDEDLDAMLLRLGVPGIAGIDTRRLTRHIRDSGAMPGAFGTADEATLRAAAQAEPGTDGIDLVAQVTTDAAYKVDTTRADGVAPWNLVAMDFGIKTTILHHLAGIGDVTVVPAAMPIDEIRALAPDGVFLSNGPGDPDFVAGAPDTIKGLIGEVPIFGICLGHQLLAGALGAETFKLPFGHHGGNHPVRRLSTGVVEITSQNHNFCVADGSLDTADISHINLNDETIEGLIVRDAPAFSVQYHPEAGPGPHDSRYLFTEFDELIASVKGRS